jgi:hypothetical protein
MINGCFLGIPSEVIDAMLFAKQGVKAEDVISALTVDYIDSYYIEMKRTVARIENDGTVSGHLPDLLRRKESEDPDFATKFVEFATGCPYLPHYRSHPDFKITIEFNRDESKHDDSLIVSHTCVKTVKLPGKAYNGDMEKLEQKLMESIENSEVVGFDMR